MADSRDLVPAPRIDDPLHDCGLELPAVDRLLQPEVDRCYSAIEYLEGAEVIEGVVYLPSPGRIDLRGAPHAPSQS